MTDSRERPSEHNDANMVEWCDCTEGPYFGAQKMGTPPRCERCGFLPDLPWVHAAMLDALTRAGVLTDDHRTLDDGWAMYALHADGTELRKGKPNTRQRRLVTGWETR